MTWIFDFRTVWQGRRLLLLLYQLAHDSNISVSIIPASNPGVMKEPGHLATTGQIEAILRSRGYHLLQHLDSPPNYTFDNPHSCQYCCDEVIVVGEGSASSICDECKRAGASVPHTESSRRGACLSCGKGFEYASLLFYAAIFQHGLEEAIKAATFGCALYVRLLRGLGSFDTLVRDLADRYSVQSFEADIDALKFHLKGVDDVDGLERRLWPKIRFGEVTVTTGHLYGWTKEDDQAARYIDARPHELDVKSSASWKFAQTCFQACKEGHSRCRSRLRDSTDDRWERSGRRKLDQEVTNLADVPLRLLQLSPDSSTVRIEDVKDMTDEERSLLRSSGFAILSYCWGRQQSLILTAERDQYFRDGLNAEDLPKTIQDAIRTTRELNVRYLWIDALCIYQDSDEDKIAEISRMAQYYTSATITICAAAAINCDQGFLYRRQEPSYTVGPIRLLLRHADRTNLGHVYLIDDGNRPSEATATRGWTMQESLLSRRLLIYAERQLYWCCASASAGPGGAYRQMIDRLNSGVPLVEDIYPIADLLTRPVKNMWQQVLTTYTTRKVGVSSDKLPAVSALVEHVLALSKERGENVDYVAGMLIDLEEVMSWLDQLLWYTLDPNQSSRARGYRAPSWTWAAVDGSVQPMVIPQSIFDNPAYIGHAWEGAAKILSYAVEPMHQNVPYGGVRSGYVDVEAHIRPVSECASMSRVPLRVHVSDRDFDDIRKDMSPRIELLPDTKIDADLIQLALSTNVNDEPANEISLLLLQKRPLVRESLGLIVLRCESGYWKRKGIFHVHQGKEEDISFDFHKMFNTCTVQMIRIV